MSKFCRPGELNGRAKLKVEDVEYIHMAVRNRDKLLREAKELRQEALKKRHAAWLITNGKLGKKFGVTEGTIRSLLYGNNWKQLR